MQDNTNTEVVEEVVADEPQAEEQTEVVNEEQAEAPQEQPEEQEVVQEKSTEEAPEEKPPSRRETLRIQQLLKKYGPPPERPAPQQKDVLDYSQELEADPEVIQRLEADRKAASQSSYNEGLEQAQAIEWRTSLKIDAPVIEKKYPVLDKESDQFHPAVADAINNWYLSMSGYDPDTGRVANPNVGYGDFVEGFMELVQETAGQKNAQTVKNITKQAAQTGLRPDGSSATRMNLNKSPQDMTNEELYAALGQKPPQK